MTSTEPTPSSKSALTLEFDAPEFSVSDLSDLMADVKSFVGGIALPSGLPPTISVRWIVRTVSKESPLKLDLVPTARLGKTRVDAPGIADLPTVAVRSLDDLLNGIRPTALNDQALGHMRTLWQRAEKHKAVVRISSVDDAVELTPAVATTVGEILDPSYTGVGTVDGRLDLINMHGSHPLFAIYDDLTGKRVDCRFSDSVTLQQATAALTLRVEVEGEISYRSDGNIVRIVAHRLTEFPPDDSLPGPYDVLGILNAS